MITVEKQFQIVVQAQRAHEQAGASGVVERSRASQVHTRDHRQAAHPQPTMEREISFVSTCNSPWGISFPSFLSSLSIGGDQNLIVERDTGLIYTFFSLSLFFSFFFFPPSFFQRHRWHQYGHPAPGHMVSGVVYRAASSPILLDGVDFDGYVCEWCDEWNFFSFSLSFFHSIFTSIWKFFGDWSEIGVWAEFFSPFFFFFLLFLVYTPTFLFYSWLIILTTRWNVE